MAGKWKKLHPLLKSVLLTVLAGSVCTVAVELASGYGLKVIPVGICVGALVGLFFVWPWVLTAAEIYLAVKGHGREDVYRKGRTFDMVTVPLGVVYSILFLSFLGNAVYGADWEEVLYNSQRHTPVYTQALPTVLTLALVGYVGYLVTNFLPLKRTPPLIPVLSMAAMYLGTAESILWAVQVYRPEAFTVDIYLLLLPLNCVIITARTVRHKVWEWKQLPHEEQETENKSILQSCNRILMRSEHWPFAALLLMWPLLGILIGVLLLFGQRPDAVIRAFTETADWNLSQRIAPQNVFYDEHYLCTVAAGGHERVVKPKRLGVRHGHEVIVNRQLCVANAFEQILEERTPRLHRAVRHFYDTYGFPVARLIRSKYTADLIYFLMKPLEWLFWIVLYLSDVNPENRIAIQYTGKSLKDFYKEQSADESFGQKILLSGEATENKPQIRRRRAKL